MSQAALAEKLGVSTGTVAAWELDGKDGGHGFRLDRLPEIANALGVSISELVRRAS